MFFFILSRSSVCECLLARSASLKRWVICSTCTSLRSCQFGKGKKSFSEVRDVLYGASASCCVNVASCSIILPFPPWASRHVSLVKIGQQHKVTAEWNRMNKPQGHQQSALRRIIFLITTILRCRWRSNLSATLSKDVGVANLKPLRQVSQK